MRSRPWTACRSRSRRIGLVAALLVGAGVPGRGRATPPDAVLTPVPTHLVEGRLLLSLPAALPTGMTTGVELAYTRGRLLCWGVRVSWGTATEFTPSWEVRHDDLRLRAVGALQRSFGRATVGVRLGVGGTLVHELRTRSQGNRAGLTGEALTASAWRLLPALELEPTVVLRLLAGFGLSVSGGPSLHLLDGAARFGWLAGAGIAWQR
ncbi:MAG: hypothetical protein IT371_22035 [Deltaproteobacteria bacterium]|nr:hypothetical protein [Deltaproteobacteria bacterium]